MNRATAILVLLSFLVSSCALFPEAGQTPTMLPETETPVPAPPTPSLAAPTATIVEFAPTRRPRIDPALAGTQTVATVEASQITWSGAISPLVFRELMSQEAGTREAFRVPKSDELFNVSTRPVILAAYFYKVSSEEKFHARFLLYEPGGMWGDEVVSPFIYKMDLPLSWIGGHEDYGPYDHLIRDLEAQFEHPISPNKLIVAVFAANHCADAKNEYKKLCAELERQGIQLPPDYGTAKSMVMDQWNLAIQRTSEVGDIEQVVEQVNMVGTDWWEDDHFVLFYLPYVSVCLPGDPPLCGTYISYEMRIDAFGLLRP
jgi:hypothetical protein